ncbi:exopolysaccharide biosynthesis protein [Actibacterium sp. 188UL27-1]|uniref:exopolysaccharide biosynthesis protein n=1 Tax=Actibacterium sp. 188UL27-1 TaxID=2786961 RepID=UPI00195DE792|nr:exopolysaccharide biosynthesis protein [Actibacterium sp. 188UL27-1]MBM7068971.1 exopolysaccharide biosynthesis protein [Actibacterium sp. 188UL27-1]
MEEPPKPLASSAELLPESEGPLPQIIDDLRDAGDEEVVTVADVFETIGGASYAPALLVPALILITPLSGIFGVPTILALIMLLISAQALVRRRDLWLPSMLLRRGVPTRRFNQVLDTMDEPVRWVDRFSRKRLNVLISGPLSWIPFLLTALICIAIPPMEIIPLLSSVAALSIAFMAFGLLARDGVFVLLGYGIFAGVATALLTFLSSTFG